MAGINEMPGILSISRRLTSQPPYQYVVGFVVDLYMNPVRAYHGSVAGNVQVIGFEKSAHWDIYTIWVKAKDNSSASSATHLPPEKGADVKTKYQSLYPDNPFGPNGFMRTIHIEYDMLIRQMVPVNPSW